MFDINIIKVFEAINYFQAIKNLTFGNSLATVRIVLQNNILDQKLIVCLVMVT